MDIKSIAATQKPRNRTLMVILPVVLILALAGYGYWGVYLPSQPERLENGMPINTAIEERFGVRFLSVSVVGKGGLVDVRYQVTDAGKAANFGHYTETSPLIVSQVDGSLVEVTIMGMHNHRVETGRIYYILFRNTQNALTPGDKVTIQIDDLFIEDVITQ